jgi:hypothetical protein
MIKFVIAHPFHFAAPLKDAPSRLIGINLTTRQVARALGP